MGPKGERAAGLYTPALVVFHLGPSLTLLGTSSGPEWPENYRFPIDVGREPRAIVAAHRPTSTILNPVMEHLTIMIGATPTPPSDLPPAARAQILIILLSVAIIGIVALLAITLLRRSWRRSVALRNRQAPRARAENELNAWEQAGRRAVPEAKRHNPPSSDESGDDPAPPPASGAPS